MENEMNEYCVVVIIIIICALDTIAKQKNKIHTNGIQFFCSLSQNK